MPAKSKTKPEEAMLETPAGTAVAGEAPVRPDWPEATERREVTVTLTDDERINVGLEHIKQISRTAALTAEKKASAKQFSIEIDDSKQKEAEISEAYLSGKARRVVSCTWHFQTNNRDADGNLVYHSQLKTLTRDDTGEVVEVKPITDEDRQLILPLGEEESLEVHMAAITAAGYALAETPDDSDHDEPFLLTAPDGGETPIQADSLAEAAAIARQHLPQAEAKAEPQEEETAGE